MQSVSVTVMVVGESGFLLLDMTMDTKKPPACEPSYHRMLTTVLSVTVWQNSTEYYCAASADILLQLVAKSDYVLY